MVVKLEGDSVARFVLPLDTKMSALLIRPTRSYLGLCHLPRATSRFINERMVSAVRKLAERTAACPIPVRLTLRTKGKRVEVSLRVSATARSCGSLAPLAKGAPENVRAVYRSTTRGMTLSFTAMATPSSAH